MNAAQIYAPTDYHKYDKWFTIAKVLLVLAPFVALAYLNLFTMSSSISLMLRQNPQITLTFLIAMAGPFTAYLLSFAQKHYYEGDAAYMMSYLSLLLAAELLLRNGMYIFIVACLMFLVYRQTGMSPFAALGKKWKEHFFRELSGCIVLIVFGIFCLFVSLRLGM